LEQASDDMTVKSCADESVTEATVQGFVFGIIERRDRLGGNVEFQALIID